MNDIWKVKTTLGAIYPFTHVADSREEAFECAEEVSRQAQEPVDVLCNNRIVAMFKNGKKY